MSAKRANETYSGRTFGTQSAKKLGSLRPEPKMAVRANSSLRNPKRKPLHCNAVLRGRITGSSDLAAPGSPCTGKLFRTGSPSPLTILRRQKASPPVWEVTKLFLAEKENLERRSDRYLIDVKIRLSQFNEAFGERMISTLAAEGIISWLNGLGVGIITRNTVRKPFIGLADILLAMGVLVPHCR